MSDVDAKLLSVNQTAHLCGVSRRTLLRWDADGTLGPRSIKLGRLRRWRRDELDLWIYMGCPKRRTFREQTKGHTYGATAQGTKSGMEAA